MSSIEAPPGVDYDDKWRVMAAIGTGVLLATIDGSIVNIALPTIRDQLSTSLPVVQWVAVGYLLTLATLTLVVGRWGDIAGKRRIYIAGFVLFTAASVVCGLAPTVELLIAFRVVQAVGAAMTLSLGAAILVEAFPTHERGKALGLIGTFVSLGVITGPVVGGLLIAAFDWRAIFFVNLPVGIIGTVLAVRHVPDLTPTGGQRFDIAGSVTFSGALLCISLAVTAGQSAGYASLPIIGLFIGAAVFAWSFVVIERRVVSPMIDLTMLRNPVLSVSVISGFLVFVSVAAIFFLLPFYLEGVLGYDTRRTGVALALPPLVLGLVSPSAGTLSDRVGVRRITLLGLVVIGISTLGFLTMDVETTFIHYALVAIPLGLGIGMFQSPNNSAIMGSVPRAYSGVAGGMLTLSRLLGQISGVAVLGSVWASRVVARAGSALDGDAADASPALQVAGLHDIALVIVAFVAIAIVIGWWGMRREAVARGATAGGAWQVPTP